MPKEDNSLKADFVYSLASSLMAQIRSYERTIEQLQQEKQELLNKLEALKNTPLEKISTKEH